MKKLLFMAIVGILAASMPYVPVQAAESTTVTLTDNGFVPRTVTVSHGAAIRFVTTRGRYFWPASDDHPAHTMYSAFDAKGPVPPDGYWEFRFEQAGTWNYHDHISPSFTGEIVVTSSGSAVVRSKQTFNSFYRNILSYLSSIISQKLFLFDYDACRKSDLGRSDRIACWEKIVVAIVQRRGLSRAMDFVDKEAGRDIAFAADCHVYVHRIGEEYYWKFARKKQIEISDRLGICDLGFFHGFMQEFASHGTTTADAKRYCDIVTGKMKRSQYPLAVRQQCYHGIGHGLAFLYASYHWGEKAKIISRGIADCENMLPDSPGECVNGVYGGMAAMYWGLHGFTLALENNDAFFLCRRQPASYSSGCFDQFVPVLFSETKLDLLKAGRVIEQIPDEATARVAMAHAGGMPSYTMVPRTSDYSEVLHICRQFRAPLSDDCLHGFAAALVRIGTFRQAVERGRIFCEDARLTAPERSVCFAGMYDQIRYKYSDSETQEFCTHIRSRGHEDICGGNKS